MRTKEEILQEKINFPTSTTIEKLTLEILLDIRELLQDKKNT